MKNKTRKIFTLFLAGQEELDQELEDGYLTTLFAYPESGSGELVVAFRNKSGETKKLRDITILDVNYYPCETIDIAFPGGITFSSTKDDVLNLWNGTEPVLEDESTLMYENKENYDGIDYYFDEEGTLSEVSLHDNKEQRSETGEKHNYFSHVSLSFSQ